MNLRNEVPEDHYENLKFQIFQSIMKFSATGRPKMVLTQLCIAMVRFVFQATPTIWPNAIVSVVHTLHTSQVRNEWMNEWVSEWMNEWMNEWMREYLFTRSTLWSYTSFASLLLLSKSCCTLEFKLFKLTIFIVAYHITSSCIGTSMTMCIRYTLSVTWNNGGFESLVILYIVIFFCFRLKPICWDF